MPINHATFSMKTFMDHVKSANWTFKLAKSSLNPLVTALGGDHVASRGLDQRTLDRQQLETVQGIIWPLGDGVTTSPWGKKKRKYKNALGYLAHTLYQLAAADALLVGSYKTSWEPRQLTGSMKFTSGSGAREAQMAASGGLATRFASELCIPMGGMIGDWAVGHKFVFGTVMRLDNKGRLLGPGGIKTQGFGTNVYCFQRDALTDYMCMYDVENSPNYRGEIAFPADVPTSYIKLYVDGAPKAQPLWPSPNWT